MCSVCVCVCSGEGVGCVVVGWWGGGVGGVMGWWGGGVVESGGGV